MKKHENEPFDTQSGNRAKALVLQQRSKKKKSELYDWPMCAANVCATAKGGPGRLPGKGGEGMELKAIRRGPRIKVELTGDVDHHNADSIREALDALIMDKQVTELVLDLSAVTFMDSSGLGVILGRYRTLTRRGGRLLLSGVPHAIDKILKMAGIYSLVDRA